MMQSTQSTLKKKKKSRLYCYATTDEITTLNDCNMTRLVGIFHSFEIDLYHKKESITASEQKKTKNFIDPTVGECNHKGTFG